MAFYLFFSFGLVQRRANQETVYEKPWIQDAPIALSLL